MNRKRNLMILILLTGAMGATLYCRPGVHTSPEILALKGRSLDGQDLELKTVASNGLVLNFYSPTCIPCIEELPALHQVYARARELGIDMYLAVAPDLESNGVDPLKASSRPGFDEMYPLLRDRLNQDRKQYKIQIPMLVLRPPFSIKEEGPVTGTPETVFLMTRPLRLYYNLIGPIALGQTNEQVNRSSRFQFALEILGHLASAAGKSEPKNEYY
ncbi:MAG: redoxin domain-containing protein [Leptospiraceae bacterium]|nr:redoxin domain-containing protein [Leptospiraceae bacterium]